MPLDPGMVSAAAAPRFDVRAFVACGAATLLAGVVYLNALHNPFVYDDYRTIVANTSIQSVANLPALVLHDVKRPIVNVSYAIDRALWGPAPLGFHVTNVLLHMLNVVLLFYLALRLSSDRVAAFAAAALFAVHPMMTEAVGYISGRSELLCAIFFLPAVMCGRRWLRGDGARWAAFTVAFWMASLASKETAAMFPFVLLALDWFAGESTPEKRRRRLMTVHAPLIGVTLVAGVARLALLALVEYPGQIAVHWRYLLLELDVVRRYVWLMVNPRGQTLFHAVAPVGGLLEVRALVAIGAVGLMIAMAWRLRRVEWPAGFGIFWFLLLLVPSSALAVLDQGEPMAEHRVYIASVGLFLAAGIGIGRLASWLDHAGARLRLLGRAALVVVLMSLGTLTVLRNNVWANPVTLMRESVDLAPGHFRPRLLLGEALQDTGRRAEAVEEFRNAIRLRPNDPMGYVKLGRCLFEMGRLREARSSLVDARRIDPRNELAQQSLRLLDEWESRLVPDAGRR
jgi:protein O-mannosyl-transferase